MTTYSVQHDSRTGQPVSILRSDGACIPLTPANADFQSFLAWNKQQPTPLDYTTPIAPTARTPRTLLAIYNDIKGLTSTQQNNIWADLSAGTPPKFLTDNGSEPGVISTYHWIVTYGGYTGNALLEAKFRIAAVYVRDNPAYLVNPTFDPSINIPGDQVAS